MENQGTKNRPSLFDYAPIAPPHGNLLVKAAALIAVVMLGISALAQ